MRRFQQDLYAESSLERAMFERRRRSTLSSFGLGSMLLLGILVLAALSCFGV